MTVPTFTTGAATAAQLNVLVAQSNDDHTLLGSLPGVVNLQSAGPNLSDFSSATMADWLTGLTVPVPTFAADGLHQLDLMLWANPIVITTASTWAFRLVASVTNGTTSGGYIVPTITAVISIAVGLTGYVVPAASTTVAVKAQAQRTAGASGAIRLNTATGNTYGLLAVFHT